MRWARAAIVFSAVAALAGGAAVAGRATDAQPPLWAFLRQIPDTGNPAIQDIFTSDGGAAWTNITPDESNVLGPWWSPDGTAIAYIVTRNTFLPDETNDVVVEDWDGSNRRQLTHGATAKLVRWSPDGKRIAYRAFDGIWVVNVDGSGSSRIDPDAAYSFLDWSPDGEALVHDTSTGAIAVTSVATGETRKIAQAIETPTATALFSPDGTRVAYLDGSLHLRVVDSDGGNDHLATSTPAYGLSGWRPDGEIVFASAITSRGTGFDPTYGGAPVETSIWAVKPTNTVAKADRLTGPYTAKWIGRDLGVGASFSGDGNQMTYHALGGVWRANGDGTCARRLASYTGAFVPIWNPARSAARTACVDLQTFATGPRTVTRGRAANVAIHIENHGSEPATDVTVTIAVNGKAHLGACAPVCHIAQIPSRSTKTINLPYRSARTGRGTVSFSVHGGQRNYSADALSGTWRVTVTASR